MKLPDAVSVFRRGGRKPVPVPSAEGTPGAVPNETPLEDDLARRAHSSGDPFKEGPYYDWAEPYMDQHWGALIWPEIEHLDFGCVVELAPGHGRNSARLLQYASQLILVDINQECIDHCRRRFGEDSRIRYLVNDGASLKGIDDASATLIYTFDSMVHFDSEVVKAYLKDFHRVLRSGGHCFCHHSNFTGNPGGDLQQSPAWRNFMSKELFAHYSIMAGLQVVKQTLLDWGGQPQLDCLTLLRKPV